MVKDQIGYDKDQALVEIALFTALPMMAGMFAIAFLLQGPFRFPEPLDALFWISSGMFAAAGLLNFLRVQYQYKVGMRQRCAAASQDAAGPEVAPAPLENPEEQA